MENYLSAKFDRSIAAASDKYSGDTLYNYDSDVFGIGRGTVDTTAFANSGAAGFGIQATGGFDAGEYVMAGHSGIAAGIIPVEGAPLFTGERWTRVWNVDTNGSELDATIGFNFADAGLGAFFDAGDSFQLLYSSTPNPASWEILSLDGELGVNNTIEFNLASGLLLDGFYTLGINVGAVPEPQTMTLLGLGMLGMVVRRRKSRRANGL